MTSYQPLEDRILVEPIKEVDEKTEGGLFIPDTIRKEVSRGVVRAVGPGLFARDTGVLIQTILHEGEEVLYGSNQGITITVDKKEMRVMREGDVIMLISKKEENS